MHGLQYDEGDLLSILNDDAVEHESGQLEQRFWPRPVLASCLTQPRVLKALTDYCPGSIATKFDLANKVCFGGTSGTPSYLRVFAILVLCEQIDKSGAFISTINGFDDTSLPLRSVSQGSGLKLKVVGGQDGDGAPTLPCFRGWQPHEVDYFLKMQWHVIPHVFRNAPGDEARHEKLEHKRILPWVKIEPGEELYGPKNESVDGAFGRVSFYKVHPSCHEFSPLLRQLKIGDTNFAVKTLLNQVQSAKSMKRTKGKTEFQHEAEQLRRFNGKSHPHLVTLLATYQQDNSNFFVFPYAKYDLLSVWEEQGGIAPTSNSLANVQWLATQLHGLMEALSRIHEPLHLPEKKYGRHGDIKADNVLCYAMPDSDKWLLVLTDLGLSALNSEHSRSNIPGEEVIGAPGYRPPECDVKGGFVSRLYDVWTMGCLFLDAITYSLGGMDLREDFAKRRTTKAITGGSLDSFYDANLLPGSDGKAIQFVKPEVTKWIDGLRRRKNSTKFTADVLDIVEKEMLVVLVASNSRSSSKLLTDKLFKILQKCTSSGCEDYCMKSFRQPPRMTDTVGVEVKLTDKVLNQALHIRQMQENHLEVPEIGRQAQRSIDFARFEAEESLVDNNLLQPPVGEQHRRG